MNVPVRLVRRQGQIFSQIDRKITLSTATRVISRKWDDTSEWLQRSYDNALNSRREVQTRPFIEWAELQLIVEPLQRS